MLEMLFYMCMKRGAKQYVRRSAFIMFMLLPFFLEG